MEILSFGGGGVGVGRTAEEGGGKGGRDWGVRGRRVPLEQSRGGQEVKRKDQTQG